MIKTKICGDFIAGDNDLSVCRHTEIEDLIDETLAHEMLYIILL